MGKRSFSRRLSWRIIGIVSAIIVTMLLVVGIVSNQIIADEATRAAQHILHGTISEIERPLGHVEIITATVAAHAAPIAASAKPSDKAIHSLLQQTVRLDSLVTGCSMIVPGNKGNTTYYCFADAEGEMHSGILDTARAEARYIDAMTDAVAKKGQALWTDPHRQLGFQDARSITYCYPVYADGRLLAIITSDLSIEWMEHKIESLRPYKNSLTSILCSGGGVIGIKDTNMLAQIRKSFAEDKELASLGEDLLSGKDSLRRRIGKGRNLSFVVFGPLHNGWTLSLTCMYRDVLERVTKMQLNLLIIGFFGLLVLFFVCRLVIRRLSKPITQLSESALNMAKGDFKAELPEIKSQDEMKNLRDSFVFMQNSIAAYIEELKTTTAANERMESELGVARNIQMGMLRTDFPPQLHALLTPAKEVGGDLYDYIIKDKTLYFAVGDVSGKGVPASLMMAITRAALRFVSGLNLPMNETMSRINSSVCDINSNNMFVTLFVGRIDLTTGRMEYCNAGHNPIMILPVGGKPYFLKAKPNLAVGLFEDFPYQSESIDLAAGTRIVAYTDGVNEAENADKALFGNDRLLQWAEEVDANDSEQAVVESLYDVVKAFADGNPQNDDITIMSIKL